MILEPLEHIPRRGAYNLTARPSNTIFMQRPRQSRVDFFQSMPPDSDTYGLIVAPALDATPTYLVLTPAEWKAAREARTKPDLPPCGPVPSVWEWIRKPAV